MIANDHGNRTTPSYVSFSDTEKLISDVAKHHVAMNLVNTIFDAKRLIVQGRGKAIRYRGDLLYGSYENENFKDQRVQNIKLT